MQLKADFEGKGINSLSFENEACKTLIFNAYLCNVTGVKSEITYLCVDTVSVADTFSMVPNLTITLYRR